jgi:hypothetical protein
MPALSLPNAAETMETVPASLTRRAGNMTQLSKLVSRYRRQAPGEPPSPVLAELMDLHKWPPQRQPIATLDQFVFSSCHRRSAWSRHQPTPVRPRLMRGTRRRSEWSGSVHRIARLEVHQVLTKAEGDAGLIPSEPEDMSAGARNAMTTIRKEPESLVNSSHILCVPSHP